MNTVLRKDAEYIIASAIRQVMPDVAVKRALEEKSFPAGKLFVLAVGKAAWQMAKAASDTLGDRVTKGIVITKYDHVKGDIPHMVCYEAGHPVPDENSFAATQAAIDMVSGLQPEDTVIFLVSGGGSALFEKPRISGTELADITKQLLACGADIVEMNTVRKRLSAVKGGKFALLAAPAQIYAVVLSDILGDPLDMFASGPAYPDHSTCEDALRIVEKYRLDISGQAKQCLQEETPKTLDNVDTVITGSVADLCRAAAKAAEDLGYRSEILTDRMSCQAKEAGAFLGAIARTQSALQEKSAAYIVGGETVVQLTGNGMGGRNQELALAAAEEIAGIPGCAVFSVGSDGTDGPTDAAGGFADEKTKELLEAKGIRIYDALRNNDAYHALKITGGLLMTGATGTNVNDVAVVLVKKE